MRRVASRIRRVLYVRQLSFLFSCDIIGARPAITVGRSVGRSRKKTALEEYICIRLATTILSAAIARQPLTSVVYVFATKYERHSRLCSRLPRC